MNSSQRTWLLSDDRRPTTQQSPNLSGYNNPLFGEDGYHIGDNTEQTLFISDSGYGEDTSPHAKPSYQGGRDYVYQQEIENPTSPHQPSYTRFAYSTPNHPRENTFQSSKRYHYGTRIGSQWLAGRR